MQSYIYRGDLLWVYSGTGGEGAILLSMHEANCNIVSPIHAVGRYQTGANYCVNM